MNEVSKGGITLFKALMTHRTAVFKEKYAKKVGNE